MPDQPGVRLAELTTLRLGGPARRLVRAGSEDALVAAVRAADAAGDPLLVVGGGSNLVVSDDGFDGTVVVVDTRGASQSRGPDGDLLVTVAAGEPWDEVVAATVADGFGGLAALSGIPGLAGATPVQNVGAYGQEVADVLVSVRVLDRGTGAVRELTAAECGFGYRDSRFKRDPAQRLLVLALTVRLAPGDPAVRYAELARTLGVAPDATAPAAAVREAVLGLRTAKGMVVDPTVPDAEADPDTRSAGSFFTNPVLPAAGPVLAAVPHEAPRYPAPDGLVKVSAAWLVEHAGFPRGYGHGDARISGKHALALTNRGAATTAQLLALAGEVVDGVHRQFGVRLVAEPVLVGCEIPAS